MFKLSILLCFFGINMAYLSGNLHDFHMSKSEVKLKTADKHLQMSVHIFIDDLESALRKKGIDSLYVGTEKESDLADEYLSKYLKQVLLVSSNDEQVELNFLGKELSNDLMAIWCYLEATDLDECDDLVIENKILIDLFDDQKNVLFYSNDKGLKSHYLFDSEDQVKSFSCE